MERITKAELARRAGVSKPRVSQLIARGLPVNEDGSITWDDALNWLNAHSAAKSKIRGNVQDATAPEMDTKSERWAFLDAIENPAHRLAVKGVMQLSYEVPALACLTMLDAGIPVATAKSMFHQLALVAMEQAAEVLAQIEPFKTFGDDAPVWDMDAFWLPAWEKIEADEAAR